MWRRRFSRKSLRINKENDEILHENAVKYRKKVQSTITQINRTRKSIQNHFDSSDSEVHVARLINDVGQLSDCKSLQEITSFIDSLAMRYQLSCRIFNEYGTTALSNALENLNNNLSKDFERTKSVFEEARSNRFSTRTRQVLHEKVEDEWSKHQNYAVKQLKTGLASYCQIALKHLKVQVAMTEKLQEFVDEIPENDDIELGLPDFSIRSAKTRRELDILLRVLLDTATADLTSPHDSKRPKFLEPHHSLSNSLFSNEVTEAISRSHRTLPGVSNPFHTPRNTNHQIPEHQSTILSPNISYRNDMTPKNSNNLPSYTDLFIVPATCREDPVELNQ